LGNSRIPINSFRAAFLFVVVLFAAAASFTLIQELRTNERVNDLVTRALRRDGLIARIRVDALQLEESVDDHIRAPSDEERAQADQQMARILEDISPTLTVQRI